MGEEVLSPTTPNASRSPPQHQIQLSQSRGGQGQPAQGNEAYAPPKPTKGEWGTKQDKTSNKLRWHGLHVATNFSKPPTLAQKAAEQHAKQEQGLGLQGKERPVPPSRAMSVETLGLGHQQSKRNLKPSSSKGRIGDLTRASSKFSNLSPSDRAVVIGLSLSPEELDRHATSPEATPIEPRGVNDQRTLGRRPSIAPTITLTTPANEQAPWSTGDEEEAFHTRQRAASSVYSQVPPPYPDGRVIDSSIVPPIPPLPPDARKHNAQVNQANERQANDERSRVVSTCTVFDDEDTPMTAKERSNSRKSQLRVLTKQASMDTLATRHRSQGWWNHIVSPFFPKSPMTFKFPSSTLPHEPAPAEQDPLHSGKSDHDRDLEKSSRSPYPKSPKLQGPGSSHTSWTDSTLEAECEKRALNFDDSPTKNRGTLVIGQPPGVNLSPPPAKFEGFGAAAEYYEACLYDMYSPEPFFECQNHTCLPRRTDSIKALPAGMDASSRGMDAGPNGIYGIPEDPQKEQPQLLAVDQTARNRSSAAFHEASTPKSKARPDSEATVIDEFDATPMVQEAHVAPVVRAPEPGPAAQPPLPREEPAQSRAVEEPSPLEEFPPRQPPVYSSPEKETPNKKEKPPKKFIAVMPPDRTPAPYKTRYDQPASPEPISPGMQRQAPKDAIPMDEVRRKPVEPAMPPKTPITPWGIFNRDRDSYYQEADRRYEPPRQTTLADLYPPPKGKFKDSRTGEVREKDLPARETKSGKLPKCRNCFRSAKPKNKKEKRIMIAIATGLVLLIVLILVLAMTLTRKSNNKMPVQSQWLNLTGFPPIPTGFSTIVQPQNVGAVSGCVEPQTMWSCAVPKEEQQGILPNKPNQPNFRMQILFQNGTNATANAAAGNSSSVNKRSYGHIANAVSAGGFIRHKMLEIRNLLRRSDQYTPDPAPPSFEDQTFLGNSTDQILGSLDGYDTPFFISFVPATKLPSRLVKRSSSSSSSSATNSSDQFPDTGSAIPPPDSNPNGTAAGANLYPYPTNQPLRLYNKGLDTEHYGFYTYFDRSIFLKSTAPLNATSSNIAPVPDDNDGGADEIAASVRCTWAQTRFLVRMWTKKGNSTPLLGSTNGTESLQNTNATTITSSSANDFAQPGSFPYPVTITLDRHGGDISSKMIYCYGMGDQEHIVPSEKKLQLEDRGFGGQLVNKAMGPFGATNVSTAQGGPGGIDGGTGGCSCTWQNWETG